MPSTYLQGLELHGRGYAQNLCGSRA